LQWITSCRRNESISTHPPSAHCRLLQYLHCRRTHSNVDTCDVSTPLVVESYDIYNGSNDDYVDDKYPGGPDNAQVQLVDGQGDLTDGIIPQISWKFENPVRSGPYVGYLRSSLPGSLSTNNAIPFDFMFTQDEIVSKVEISVDDPLPASSGGVTAPDKVIIGGIEYNFPPNPNIFQMGEASQCL